MSGSDRTAGPTPPGAAAPDLRLLAFVGPLWLGQAAVLLVGAAPVGLALGAAVMLFGPVVAVGWLRLVGAGQRRGCGAGVEQRVVAAALAAGGLGLGSILGGLHLMGLQAGPLSDVVAQAAVVGASVRVTGDPREHRPVSDGGRPPAPAWSVPARLERLQVRGRDLRLRVPILLQGDQVQHLRYGTRVDLVGRAQPAWSPTDHALALRVLGRPVVRAPPGPVARATTVIRESFRQACAGLPDDAGALLLGLSVGDESTLPASLEEAMRRTGLSHLTAVSGSNTSLVAGLALGLVAAVGLGWRTRIAFAATVLLGYVALVRPQPSVLRAAAMGAVALVALGLGGRRRGAPALLAAVLVLLVLLPQYALSLGFALSVSATAGLLVVGPPLAERLGRWPATRWAPPPVRAALAVATAAHLATLPLALLMGNGASLVALPANVVVTPFVPPATVVGLAAAMVAPFSPGTAGLLAQAAAPFTGAIAWVARTGAAVPGGVVDVPGGAASGVVAATLLGLAGLMAARGWRPWRDPRIRLLAAVLAVTSLLVREVRDAGWPPRDWLVLACDVGQGDGLLVRAPGATDALLVDAGPDPASIRDCVRDSGVRRVVVLLSHFHADHVGGLAGVVGRWPVPAILTSPVAEPPDGVGLVLRTAAGAGIPVRALRAGDRVVVAGVSVQVLWPARRIEASAANNGSVVALVEVPGPAPLRVLLTGDVEPEAQAALLAGPSPDADVVKVPHHGSRHQSPGFASWSGAGIALVSVGRDNDYGHPAASTVSQFVAVGAVVGRSDEQGALAVTALGDRAQLWVQR